MFFTVERGTAAHKKKLSSTRQINGTCLKRAWIWAWTHLEKRHNSSLNCKIAHYLNHKFIAEYQIHPLPCRVFVYFRVYSLSSSSTSFRATTLTVRWRWCHRSVSCRSLLSLTFVLPLTLNTMEPDLRTTDFKGRLPFIAIFSYKLLVKFIYLSTRHHTF